MTHAAPSPEHPFIVAPDATLHAPRSHNGTRRTFPATHLRLVETRVPAPDSGWWQTPVPQHGRIGALDGRLRERSCHVVTSLIPAGTISGAVSIAAPRPGYSHPTRVPLARNIVANIDKKGTPHMQQETIAAYHADEAEQIHSVWKRLVAQYGLRNEEVECTLMREQNLVNSLNQKATDELLIVTGLRRGFTSPSSRRQASSIFHIDIAIAL